MGPKKSSRPSIIDPYSVDYAPSGRAACKVCSSLIADKKMRFCQKTWSPFHDGFDMKYSHFACGVKKVDRIEDLKGWQGLRWKDIQRVAKAFDESIDDTHLEVNKYKKWNEILWSFKDQLADSSLGLKALQPILDTNNRYYVEKKLKVVNAIDVIADGLLFGRLPPCPLCECEALTQLGPEYKCSGWISGATKCTFHWVLFYLTAPDVPVLNEANPGVKEEELDRVGLFALPESTKLLPFFSKWKPPVIAPGIKRFGSPLKCTATGEKAPSVQRKQVFDSEEEDERDVPKGKELCGLTVSSIGNTVPLRKELILLVEKHGGRYVDYLDNFVRFLLVGDDIGAAKETKRYQDAVSLGIPVMHCSFINALVSRKNHLGQNTTSKMPKYNPNVEQDSRPRGLLLRQRKFAAHYRVQGKLLNPLGKAKDIAKAQMAEQRKSKADERKRKSRMRPSIMPGSALLEVDPEIAPKFKNVEIYVDDHRNPFNCKLHSTNIAQGTNKFYALQLLRSGSGAAPRYSVFRKWGRVGAEDKLTNGCLLDRYEGDLTTAIVGFQKKYAEMTGGAEWDDRFEFEQRPGGYAYVEIAGYEDENTASSNAGQKSKGKGSKRMKKEEDEEEEECERSVRNLGNSEDLGKGPKRVRSEKSNNAVKGEALLKKEASKLDERLQTLIEMIFDKEMMVRQLEQQHLNMKKMPLASISTRQLKEGYAVLQEVQALLQEHVEEESIVATRREHKLLDATTRFYTQVPHSFEHSATPPVINTLAKLKMKVNMMEQLLDVSVANGLLEEVEREAGKDRCVLDIEYEKLRCHLQAVDPSSDDWAMIAKMVKDTHAPTHNIYSLAVENLFRCDARDSRADGVTQSFQEDLPNRMLLWHGSRLTNWVGILSQGLRIAPPEAPSTGYMFGKGLYFADLVSKSANYCLATPDDPRGVVILCEVALGHQRLMLQADEEVNKKVRAEGYDSTFGVGKGQPETEQDVWLTSEFDQQKIRVPTGPLMKNTDNLAKAKAVPWNAGVDKSSLLYNEFVVYNAQQVRIRYVVHLKFAFEDFNFD